MKTSDARDIQGTWKAWRGFQEMKIEWRLEAGGDPASKVEFLERQPYHGLSGRPRPCTCHPITLHEDIQEMCMID
ncbi:hypothetical protein [Sulfidibacter corallicola]|uniref:Uncharacterized protein n=1 Tax=Sulfidibacter corallicola TaxID=2818388 RepID=A0A8A4TIW0_SULCO|nr:hypothetical protein [Sulfidibacter corallicola]QTD49427.1 hypothetical protein J3U87_27900 [Sulfidibacter corallicola]